MRKFKKTCKKAKGLSIRIKQEEFLDRLKNPQKYVRIKKENEQEILKKIREYRPRRRTASAPPSLSETFRKIRRLAGLV